MTDLELDLLSITGDIHLIIPQLTIALSIVIILIVDLIFSPRDLFLGLLTIIALGVSLFFSFEQFSTEILEDAFHGMITVTNLTAFWHILISVSTVFIVAMGSLRSNKHGSAEFYILILGILLGAQFLVMSSNLLMLFFSLEVISLSSYAITFFSFDKRATEASLKYLLFGATASALMLYGMSLIYGITGTLDFTGQIFIDSMLQAHAVPVTIASILMVTGLLFKLSAVPFHVWAPEVYQSAPTPVVTFFSVVPKIAGLAIFIKVILAINLFGQSPLDWSILLSAIAILTIAFGNFSAIWQNNIKRLMAYSAIAQTGFLLAGLAAFSETSLTNVLFYSIIYAIAGIGAFMIIHFFERKDSIYWIKDYSGMVKSHPFMTILMLVFMLSLTGIPPTAGFTSKLFIFTSIWESFNYSNSNWLLGLLIFGLLNTVVSLFYYLKIPYYMIFKQNSEDAFSLGNKSLSLENYLSAALVLAVLILFFKPDWLMGIINNINFAF